MFDRSSIPDAADRDRPVAHKCGTLELDGVLLRGDELTSAHTHTAVGLFVKPTALDVHGTGWFDDHRWVPLFIEAVRGSGRTRNSPHGIERPKNEVVAVEL